MGPKCGARTSYAMSCSTPVSPQNTHLKRDLAGLVRGVCHTTGPQSMSVGQRSSQMTVAGVARDTQGPLGKGQGSYLWAVTWKGTRWVCFHQLPTEIEQILYLPTWKTRPRSSVFCLFEQCQQQKSQMSYHVAGFSKYHSCSSLLLNYGHYLASCCWIIFNVLIEAHMFVY